MQDSNTQPTPARSSQRNRIPTTLLEIGDHIDCQSESISFEFESFVNLLASFNPPSRSNSKGADRFLEETEFLRAIVSMRRLVEGVEGDPGREGRVGVGYEDDSDVGSEMIGSGGG